MTEMNPPADLDGAWKEALHHYLERAFALGFPKAHSEIDWSVKVVFRDPELQKIIVGSETGRRSVDILAQVRCRDGSDRWVLLHIEIQSQREARFPERMHEYSVKILYVFRMPVASFAIFADDSPGWKPDRLTIETLGTRIEFSYPVLKLTDMDPAELERSDNPFAAFILAHLMALETAHDPRSRKAGKLRLLKRLYERWGPEEVRRLARLIDWVMQLPKDLESQVLKEIHAFEQENHMPYVTSFERLTMEEVEARGVARGAALGETKGIHDTIGIVLKAKFGPAGTALIPEIQQIRDAKALLQIAELIQQSGSVEEVRLAFANVH